MNLFQKQQNEFTQRHIGPNETEAAEMLKTIGFSSLDELIEKLPGAINTNGKLQIQGEDVKQVMVDGKLFFGNGNGDIRSHLCRARPGQVW